jgi:hypothetical protein
VCSERCEYSLLSTGSTEDEWSVDSSEDPQTDLLDKLMRFLANVYHAFINGKHREHAERVGMLAQVRPPADQSRQTMSKLIYPIIASVLHSTESVEESVAARKGARTMARKWSLVNLILPMLLQMPDAPALSLSEDRNCTED